MDCDPNIPRRPGRPITRDAHFPNPAKPKPVGDFSLPQRGRASFGEQIRQRVQCCGVCWGVIQGVKHCSYVTTLGLVSGQDFLHALAVETPGRLRVNAGIGSQRPPAPSLRHATTKRAKASKRAISSDRLFSFLHSCHSAFHRQPPSIRGYLQDATISPDVSFGKGIFFAGRGIFFAGRGITASSAGRPPVSTAPPRATRVSPRQCRRRPVWKNFGCKPMGCLRRLADPQLLCQYGVPLCYQ